MRMRQLVAIIPVPACAVLLMTAGSAGATGAGPNGVAAASGQVHAARAAQPAAAPSGLALPGLRPGASGPGRRVLDDVLSGDSCTTQPDNPSITSACVAVGFFAGGTSVDGLLESSFNGTWGANTFGSAGIATFPLSVSCVPQQSDIPTCVAVGEHFGNSRFPAQLVATGGANGFSPVVGRNPKGARWSVLSDVSCVSATFCMLVGVAGPRKPPAPSHATAYRWTGSALHALKVPAPAHAREPELISVSCPTAMSCMAVGQYLSRAGRFLPYSALWTSGSWHVRTARAIRGKQGTTFEAVSCAAAGACIAVGLACPRVATCLNEANTAALGATAFAERYAHGRWTLLRIAAERRSAFFGVSCPATSSCVAAGEHGTRSLIEAWNGRSWHVQAVPRTAAPLTTDVLFHVSCVTPAICTAVGSRHNPSVRFSFRTLAVGWNGSSWSIQQTINQ